MGSGRDGVNGQTAQPRVHLVSYPGTDFVTTQLLNTTEMTALETQTKFILVKSGNVQVS